jgi:hypothetical protein
MEINIHYGKIIHLPVWLQKKLHVPEITYLGFVSIMIMSLQDAVCIVGKCWWGEGVHMRHMRDSYTIFIEKLKWKRSYWKVIFKLIINGV